MTSPRNRMSAELIAAWAIALTIAGAALAVSLVPPAPMRLGQQAIPEHVQEMNLADTTSQRHAYAILLFGTGGAAILLTTSRRLREGLVQWASSAPFRDLPWHWVVAGASIAIVWLCIGTSGSQIASLAIVPGLVIIGGRPRYDKWLGIAAAVAVSAYAGLVMIPGLLLRPDISSLLVPPAIVEAHYSAVVSHGDRLSRGFHLFSEVMPQYGVLLPSALGFIEKTHGLLSFGTHLRLVQAAQVVFCVLAFGCYWLWSGKRMVPTALVLLPMLAMANTRHLSVFLPNQSGWRFAGFPLGLLVLVALRARERRSAVILGFASGGLLLFNPETGIAISLGYVFFLLTEGSENAAARQHVSTLLRFAACASVLPIIFVIAFRAGFGYSPLPFGGSTGFALTRFAAGYGGLKLYFGIGWVVVLAHSIVEILSAVMMRLRLTIHDRIRGAVAVTILVWFAYFFNRPHEWNLWTIYFLYGFFILDFINPSMLSRYAAELRGRGLPIGAAITTMFLIVNMPNVLKAGRDGLRAIRHRPATSVTSLSDADMPSAYADTLGRRSEFVRSEFRKGPLSYFTGNVYLMPLISGVFSSFGDAYEVFSGDDFDRLVDRLTAGGPEELLFDDANGTMTGSPQRNHYYDRLKRRLATTYELRERTAGWEVWERSSQNRQ